LKGIVMVESKREIPGATPEADKMQQETRFYITSLVWLAHQLGPIVRGHWSIENSLHWVMDMLFRDDECRIRTHHAPANFTTPQAYGPQPHPKGSWQRQPAPQTQSCRLG
jgi:hypothetical protein